MVWPALISCVAGAENAFRKPWKAITDRYAHMLDMIRDQLNFDSLAYNRLDDMIDSVGIDPDKLCTYCWNGVE